MIVVLAGVSGCGKSTIGLQLAAHINAEFIEGDDFHSKHNKEAMANGQPLTDEEREPWLQAIAKEIDTKARQNKTTVVACSALKKKYREKLKGEQGEKVHFVLLNGTKEVVRKRLEKRKGHFMKEDMLESQMETLEQLQDEEKGITINVDNKTPEEIVKDIVEKLQIEACHGE